MSAARWRWIAGAVLVAVTAAVALVFASAFGHDPNYVPSALLGKAAPDFQLRTLDGGALVQLSDLRGKVVLVNFWASWCMECRTEEPVLGGTMSEYQGRGVVVLGVSFQDQDAQALAYASRSSIDWPLLVDPDSKTALAYGVGGIPETFFIDATGKVRYKQIGPLTPLVVSQEMTSLVVEAGR